MTSTTTAAPAANGTSGSNPNNPSSQSSAAGRTNPKPATAMKAGDTSRKQSGSPVDGGQRRNIPQKAWTQGTNPITQKPSYNQQNGSIPQQKAAPSHRSSMTPKETNTPDKHSNDRLTFLLANFVGLAAVITVKNGDKYSGIFSSSSLETSDSSYVLKMVQKITSEDRQSNGAVNHGTAYIGSGKDFAMTFNANEVIDLAVDNVTSTEGASRPQNGTASGFRTDTDISGNQSLRERTLQRWEPTADTEVDLSLGEGGDTSWDQFSANERLFGVKSDYDENIYTTQIDRTDPRYQRRAVEAERLAREIEGSLVTNTHMREERGLVYENDGADEEDKYSGVRRDDANFPPLQSGQPNKYTPPARRPPTGQPTVFGAPVDPAIISSQIRAEPPSDFVPPKPATSESPEPPAEQTENTKDEKVKAETPVPRLAPESEKMSTKPSATNASVSPRRAPENATATVEADVLESFRQFSNAEKLKLEERRRDKKSHDKAIKLNDLMSFSKNFKLRTAVPVDLVPILAKDKAKQEMIVEKAQREAEEAVASASNTPPKPVAVVDQKVARPSGGTRNYDVGTAPPSAPADRQNYGRGRQNFTSPNGQNNHGGRMDRNNQIQNNTTHSGRGNATGLLGHRLQDIRQQQKSGVQPIVPTPLPIHEGRVPPTGPMVDQSGLSSPQRSSAIHTPTSAASIKFNVKALEFKPNPAASTFTPAGTSNVSSSPRSNTRTRSVSRAPSPSAFFGTKKPLPSTERPSIKDQFNPIKRMKKESEDQKLDFAANGGIPQAYRTPPTWDVAQGNEDKSHSEMFDLSVRPPPSVSPQARSTSNPPMPHQHQLPLHLQHNNQHVPQAHTPHHTPGYLQSAQHHHYQSPHHFDDQHRMHMSVSSSSVFPSPRMQQPAMAYPSPMNHNVQLHYGQAQPVFMAPNGPQQVMRPYPGGPQFMPQNIPIGAPAMVQQPSNGPYLGMPQGAMPMSYNPQMQGYSPGPTHAYAQHANQSQPHSGYPSPSRAPMMMSQGSQQGHNQHPQQMMYMNPNQHNQAMYASPQPAHVPIMRGGYPQQQPQYSSSPHQTHHYPPQQHRAHSNNYGAHMGQMHSMPPAHMNTQHQPLNGGPLPPAPEGVDEVK